MRWTKPAIMKKTSVSRSALVNLRASLTLIFISIDILLAAAGSDLFAAGEDLPQAGPPEESSGIQYGQDYHHDVSPALRDLALIWPPVQTEQDRQRELREANLNPKIPNDHIDSPDPVVQDSFTQIVAGSRRHLRFKR